MVKIVRISYFKRKKIRVSNKLGDIKIISG